MRNEMLCFQPLRFGFILRMYAYITNILLQPSQCTVYTSSKSISFGVILIIITTTTTTGLFILFCTLIWKTKESCYIVTQSLFYTWLFCLIRAGHVSLTQLFNLPFSSIATIIPYYPSQKVHEFVFVCLRFTFPFISVSFGFPV